MEKKYYDLIISLIKNHRKYSGYEPILEDIAEDAYNHAKVIIDSVTNEDVITAYLNKVVNTSIITVPKKLKFNKNISFREISAQPIQPAEPVQPVQSAAIEDPVINEVITEEPAEIINDEQDFAEILEPAETIEEEVEAEDENLLEEISEEPNVELSVEVEEASFAEDLPEETIEEFEFNDISEEPEALDVIEEAETVDKTLVDKMINGINDISEDTELEGSEQEDFVLPEVEEIEATESEDLVITEEEEEETLEVDAPEELLPAEEETLEVDESEDLLSSEDDVLELSESDELVAESEDIDLLSEESVSEPIIEESPENNSSNDFTPPSYECFKFEPEIDEFEDEDEIKSEFSKVETRHPEKQISKICNLKYAQNLSIASIAEKVDMSKEDVLEILNEIINIVKD